MLHPQWSIRVKKKNVGNINNYLLFFLLRTVSVYFKITVIRWYSISNTNGIHLVITVLVYCDCQKWRVVSWIYSILSIILISIKLDVERKTSYYLKAVNTLISTLSVSVFLCLFYPTSSSMIRPSSGLYLRRKTV